VSQIPFIRNPLLSTLRQIFFNESWAAMSGLRRILWSVTVKYRLCHFKKYQMRKNKQDQ
jgi:hypothetical protein